jgi:uncharacterized membrane protein
MRSSWKHKLPALACVLFLCFDWMIFGSMHFTFKGATVAQIPSSVPFKEAVVIITGIAEIACGILVLLPRTRRIAALISLVLIIAYIPAVYHMLSSNAGLPSSPAIRGFFRTILVPHNLLLAAASLYLLRAWSPKPRGLQS